MKLSHAVPIFRMFDLEKAKEFYLDFLGFNLDWENQLDESSPVYMQVSKDNCILHLSEHFGDSCPGGSVRIETQELRLYHQQLNEKQYRHARPGLHEMPWGTLDMPIDDPFGNRLVFSCDPG